MSEEKARLGAGNVSIELDGRTVILKPTLRAAQTISRQKGGIVGAIEMVSRLDFDTIVQVVSLGSSASDRDAKDLPDRVFEAGITTLSGPIIRYLSMLANGGRPQTTGGSEGASDPQ